MSKLNHVDNAGYNGHTRRKFLALMGLAPLTLGMAGNIASVLNLDTAPSFNGAVSLPCPELFSIKGTFINAAYTHPLSNGSAEEIRNYLNVRLINREEVRNVKKVDHYALFARLINADREEISLVPSTMVGENLIASGLGLPGSKERIVTDGYHFDGSLYLYGQLAKQGADVYIVKPKNNRIDLNDMDKAIKPGTKLVAVSLVSMINGFQHDLKALCDLAHSRGAFVFADIIQAAGAVPIDVHASGIDFCACASYKWLMGDYGIGFLYVRKDNLPLLKRSQYGYRQMESMTTRMFPFDPPGNVAFEWKAENTTRGHFEVGTMGTAALKALNYSLDFLLKTGVETIQAHRQPMIDRLKNELPQLGYIPMTPEDSTSPIISFAMKDAYEKLMPKLNAADVNIQVYENRFRISPSVYNSMSDIEKLIDVLS